MADWLYPLSETSDYVLTPHGYQQPVSFDTFVDEHDVWVQTGNHHTDWCLAVNGHLVDPKIDRVWAYSCQVNGDQGVIGMAGVDWVRQAPARLRSRGAWRIGLDWDVAVTALLLDHPFPGRELRLPFGYGALQQRKRAMVRLDTHPELVVLLEHHVAVLQKYGERAWT